MVDWEAVERLRSKGWGWDRIAGDPRVGLSKEPQSDGSGRSLRALYYQRGPRRSGGSEVPVGAASDATLEKPPFWARVSKVAYLLVPLFAIWFGLAYLFPSPVGAYIAAVPTIGLFLAIAAFLLAFGLLRSAERWTPAFRSAAVVGTVLGFVVSGGIGAASIAQGCPWLSPGLSSEPGGWQKTNDALWAVHGAPVFFFYGSVACPYCSASSWAMAVALERFGSLTGQTMGHSSPTDVYPNTPEVVLAGASLQSSYVALKVVEDTNDVRVTYPSIGECAQQAYVTSYNNGGIPYLVLGGVYLHSGTLVDPGALAGMSPTVVQQQITNESGPAWTAVSGPAYLLMAFLVELNHGAPASLASDPQVQADLHQIR